ncbi:MAG TPA: redox-regulated ATPase YchF [Firmicutes bacterium]|nr:redox-regulated ATPase YchF [Bacillota bacterium]
MKIAIVGKPGSGKSTLFRMLTGSDGEIGVARVPDVRISRLSSIFKPRKTTFATIELMDVSSGRGPSLEDARIRQELKKSDLIMPVLAAFSEGKPRDELEAIITQVALADLEQVEKSIDRLRKSKDAQRGVIPALERYRELLAEGRLLYSSAQERPDRDSVLSGYDLISLRPFVAAVNLSEEQLSQGYPQKEQMKQFCADLGIPMVEFAAALEEEISELPLEEQLAFARSYVLDQPGIYRLARTAYEALGLISFFTVGEDEVRAWPIREGATAVEAAAKIHTDIARGFIRAEVISYNDFIGAGSMKAAKQAGLVRLEAKTYVVRDGDIMNFRFAI